MMKKYINKIIWNFNLWYLRLYLFWFNYISLGNFNYFWNFSSMAVICLIIKIASGIFLVLHYIYINFLNFIYIVFSFVKFIKIKLFININEIIINSRIEKMYNIQYEMIVISKKLNKSKIYENKILNKKYTTIYNSKEYHPNIMTVLDSNGKIIVCKGNVTHAIKTLGYINAHIGTDEIGKKVHIADPSVKFIEFTEKVKEIVQNELKDAESLPEKKISKLEPNKINNYFEKKFKEINGENGKVITRDIESPKEMFNIIDEL